MKWMLKRYLLRLSTEAVLEVLGYFFERAPDDLLSAISLAILNERSERMGESMESLDLSRPIKRK